MALPRAIGMRFATTAARTQFPPRPMLIGPPVYRPQNQLSAVLPKKVPQPPPVYRPQVASPSTPAAIVALKPVSAAPPAFRLPASVLPKISRAPAHPAFRGTSPRALQPRLRPNTLQRMESSGLDLAGMVGADYHIFSALISAAHSGMDVGFGAEQQTPPATPMDVRPVPIATMVAVDLGSHTKRSLENLKYWKINGKVTARIAFCEVLGADVTAGLEFTLRDRSGAIPNGIEEKKLWWIWHAHFKTKKSGIEVISTHFKAGHAKGDSQFFDDDKEQAKLLLSYLLKTLKPFERGTRALI